MDYNVIKNLEGILALKAIYVCSGKKKAAEALGSSLDTINKYIHQLEKTLQVRLISESKQGCTLTPEGLRVIECMSSLDAIWNKLCREKENKKDISGSVVIGLAMGVSTYFFMDDIMEFLDKYPMLSLEILKIEDMPKAKDDLYDVVVSYAPFESGDMIPIYKKELKCGYFASARYLSKYGYPKDFDDMIKNHRMISKKNFNTYDAGYKKVLGGNSRVSIKSDISTMLLYMVQFGAGICLAPMVFKEEGAVCLDNIPCDTKFTIYLSAHRSVKDTQKVRTVIDYCRSIIEKMNEE